MVVTFIERVARVVAVLAIVVGFVWVVWKVGNHMTWEDGLVYEHHEPAR